MNVSTLFVEPDSVWFKMASPPLNDLQMPLLFSSMMQQHDGTAAMLMLLHSSLFLCLLSVLMWGLWRHRCAVLHARGDEASLMAFCAKVNVTFLVTAAFALHMVVSLCPLLLPCSTMLLCVMSCDRLFMHRVFDAFHLGFSVCKKASFVGSNLLTGFLLTWMVLTFGGGVPSAAKGLLPRGAWVVRSTPDTAA